MDRFPQKKKLSENKSFIWTLFCEAAILPNELVKQNQYLIVCSGKKCQGQLDF